MKIILSILIVALLGVLIEGETCGKGPIPDTCKLTDEIKCIIDRASTNPIAQCAKDTVPTYTGCCPSCIFNPCTNVQCPVYTGLPVCDSSGMTFNGACPTCQIKVEKCDFDHLPTCNGLDITFSSDGCPQCKLTVCKWDELRTCSKTETATWNGLCPSCNPLNECVLKCIKDIGSIRSCADGELPALDGNCCVTCVLRLPTACTPSALSTCATTYSNLPECSGNSSMTRDRENCCVSGCKCSLDFSARKTCSAQEILSCVRSSPVCKNNEVPCLNKDSCCLSCNVGGVWSHRLETVAKCISSLRACEQDEIPTEVEGQPCKSCTIYPDFSKCTCSDPDDICVYDWNIERNAPITTSQKCIKKKKLILTFKAIDDATKAAVKYYTDNFKNEVKSAYYYLQSLFDKACSLPKYYGTCRDVLANLRNIRVNDVTIDADFTINIGISVGDVNFQKVVDVAAEKTNAKRSILQTTASDFIQSVASDNQVTDLTATTNAPSYGTTIIASFTLIVLCLLALF